MAPPTPSDLKALEALRDELQAVDREDDFERLTAALTSNLLGVPIAVASKGFQFGGDAGSAGAQDRRFRIECKKYGSTTSLRVRDLLGAIDQALAQDEALEAWFLVATRSVPEQIFKALDGHADHTGVPLVIIDWRENEFSLLAALCASSPDIVERHFSPTAAAQARVLAPNITGLIATLKRSLETWFLGFSQLQRRSHTRIKEIWNDPRVANAEMDQNVAGGCIDKKVTRQRVHDMLDSWWGKPAQLDSPAIVVGFDGVGKTWAALDWIVQNLPASPIVLLIPASAVAGVSATVTSLERLIGERLFELTRIRSADHWSRRAARLLKRPAGEGPAFTIFFDGMNQESTAPWVPLLKLLQAEPFSGRVRIVCSTRTHFFEDRLGSLRGLVTRPTKVAVTPYDLEPGGEIDKMLAFEGLSRADLHADLLELAQTPRLFRLVVFLRERLSDAKEVTTHRLLWEYGRDSFGERAGRSFSEAEWRAWLQEVARRFRGGMNAFSTRALAGTTERADLQPSEIYQRLSDILDSQFVARTTPGAFAFRPTLVAHSLAIALIADLSTSPGASFEEIEGQLVKWLDPISGMDQRAEVLRAAVNIQIERGHEGPAALGGVLVTAWLQSQNVPTEHRVEVAHLAPSLVHQLLDTIEHSLSVPHASARFWAVQAIRALPRSAGAAFDTIVERTSRWLLVVSRDCYPQHLSDARSEQFRAERIRSKVGRDESGPMAVLGVQVEFVDLTDYQLAESAPLLLEGFPLQGAMRCFEVAAVSTSIKAQSDVWTGLKWLCQLNEQDPEDMAVALRSLSKSLGARTPEDGVQSRLPARAAALLLLLSGLDADEKRFIEINPQFDDGFDYDSDYLANPSRSLFRLERRHADLALSDTAVTIVTRVQRIRDLVYDPTYTPPDTFITELRAAGAAIQIEKISKRGVYGLEDHLFEQLRPALARWAPDVLQDLVARFFSSLTTCPADSRYWAARSVEGFFILSNSDATAACAALRASATLDDKKMEDFAANELLVFELQGLDTLTQFDRIMAANLEFISLHIGEVLGKPTPDEVDELIRRYGHTGASHQRDLILLLNFEPSTLTANAWMWLMSLLSSVDADLRGLIFRVLALADPSRLARRLIETKWSWNLDYDLWTNHFGSFALMKGAAALPFDQLAPRLAPWHLLEAARRRGSDQADVRLACERVRVAVAAAGVKEPDPGSELSIDRTRQTPGPFLIVGVRPRENADAPFVNRLFPDPNGQVQALNQATQTARERIADARRAGASLYLTDLSADDLDPFALQGSEFAAAWLDGAEERTPDFCRRVRLAEGPYLALCETLLRHHPHRGVLLWKALRDTLATHYLGVAKIDDLLHIPFRVPDSPEVRNLQREILRSCTTDRALFELVLTGRINGGTAVLEETSRGDQESPYVWRQRRGIVFEGLLTTKSLPVDSAWPEGRVDLTLDELQQKAGESQSIEACARHWWGKYLAATDEAAAFAAWVLFCGAADRRAWIWLRQDLELAAKRDAHFNRKRSHLWINENQLLQAMEKREKGLDETFLFQRLFQGLRWWSQPTLANSQL